MPALADRDALVEVVADIERLTQFEEIAVAFEANAELLAHEAIAAVAADEEELALHRELARRIRQQCARDEADSCRQHQLAGTIIVLILIVLHLRRSRIVAMVQPGFCVWGSSCLR